MNNFHLPALERLRLTTKLWVGFSVGIVVALLIGLNSLSSLAKLEGEMETMYEKDLLGISYIKDANLDLIYMSRAMRHMLIAQDDATRDASLAAIKRARENLMRDLSEARKRMYRAETIDRYNRFEPDLNKALEGIEQAVGLIQRERAQPSAAAQFITSREFGAIIAAADGGLHDLTQIKAQAAEDTLQQTRANAAETRQWAVVMLALGVALTGLMGFLIGVSIQRPNDRLRGSVEALAAGEVDAPIPHTDYPNEIGVMARAIGVLQGIYRQANEQHWVKSQVADISTALQQVGDFRQLAQTTVSKLAPVIGAGHGAFYVRESDNSCHLLASYGYRERKHLSNHFAIGEGLVGQCVMEKQSILLTAPKDYIRINSGLGEGPPACIMVLPVLRGDRVLGVLEMASFQPFTGREKAVLEALLPVLATSMEIMDRNLKTQELLASTQEQAERMEKQAAQLEEQQVEMEAQQAELLETESWFRSIIESAADGMLVSDLSGHILLANPKAEAILGYEPGELLNVQIEQLVPDHVRGHHSGLREQFMHEKRSRTMGADSKLYGKRKDGSDVLLHVTLSPLAEHGHRAKCVSVSLRQLEESS